MTAPPAPHWLDLFCSALSCGPAFRRQLDDTLGGAFLAHIGASLDGFMLVPPEGGATGVTVDAAGVATVSTDLVGPDAEGRPVTLAWQAAGVAHALPSDPALESAAAAGSLEAWWAAWPEEELRQAYASSGGPPWPRSPRFPFDAKDYPFSVEWTPFPWPDVWLQLWLSGRATDAALADVVQRLSRVAERWNRTADANMGSGRLHRVGSQAAVTAGEVMVVNVDFGSAAPEALLAVLREIGGRADQTPIRRVVVGSAVLARPP